MPDDAELEDVIGGQLIVKLRRTARRASGRARSSPIRSPTSPPAADAPELVMAPTAKQAIEEVAASDNVLWVKALDDVSGKLFALTRGAERRWASARDRRSARNSTIHLLAAGGKPDLAFATVEGMLTPPTLYAVTPAAPRSSRACRPSSTPRAFGRAALRDVEGRHRVPYFLVRKKGVTRPGAGPDPRLWRLPQRPDAGLSHRPALSRRPARPVLGRGGQCLCPRQHPRRRRIWARMARGGAAREPAEAASTISTPSPRI
jgi:prolyl oligopeptidase PreP (S9A serine peptidase family)